MRTFLPIVLLAAVLTGLNAVKPLHVDDATFYFNAVQIAAHPLDPYGYTMMRWSDAVPALHALAPPVLPYWWAAAIRLFGEQPVLWKLWLFPFALLFVASLMALLRRFAPSVATPLLVLLVLSPVFLPSLNLMMDIPALSLSLLALVLFFRACDRHSLALAVLAGLTAGLAMQTKYTALLAPAVILVYALLQERLRLGFAAAMAAGLIFSAWEAALFSRYGESHFVYQLFHGENGEQPKRVLLGSLCPLLGGATPTLALVAMTILPAPRALLFVAVVLMVLPFLLVTCPDTLSCGGQLYGVANILFACNGAAMLLSIGWVAWRLVRTNDPLVLPKHDSVRVAWFLALWLILELAGSVAISPFPAVRRIMGTTIAGTLLLGCLADRTHLETWQIKALHGLVAITVLLALGFFAVDYLEARAEQQAAYYADQYIRRDNPQATIWYAGYWGFQYYAEKNGMKQIVPSRDRRVSRAPLDPPGGHGGSSGARPTLQPSHFQRGDWLVIPDEDIPQQELELDRPELELDSVIGVGDAIPLGTLMNYYAGAVPLRHQSGPRVVLRLFRVKDDFIAR